MLQHIIDPVLFIENRKHLKAKLKPQSIAVFNSNDIMPTNADGTMLFRQNNDLFYFSGIDQEETILILFPDSVREENRELLFIKETSPLIATWEGNKLTKEQATHISGITNVLWTKDFHTIIVSLILEAENIYLNSNEHSRSASLVETADRRFIRWIKDKFPLHKLERLAPIMNALRPVKHTIETELIKKAIEITGEAFHRTLKFIKPGVFENQIEAEITHTFLWKGIKRHAYTPIIASGSNACILHYIENNKVCNDGDLVLMDFGAEYSNYAADLTRTIPINGKFTNRQREVYLAVLHIMNEAKKLLKSGNNLNEYNEQVGLIVEEQLIKLNLLNAEEVRNQDPKKPLYKKHFMHGTSHFLGLDVHDLGSRYATFVPGMVFTCEPGIYIKEENLGIRLENNILITPSGNEDLMQSIPINIEDIEGIMAD